MADNTKKGGARDISELKARLGLKKGGGAAAAGAGGVVPPPSAAKISGGYVPPPPGVAPPQPQAPVIPDARVDPFGAMNAIAAQGAQRAQAAPQIIVVNDGQPVESVARRGKTVYLKWAGIVLVPMIAGIAIGGVIYKNEEYNKTIDDAKKLLEDVKSAGKPLQSMYDILLTAKDKGQGRFITGDKDLTASLEQVNLAAPDPTRFFHSHLYNMDPKLVEDTLRFYADYGQLASKVKTHINLSKSDEKKPGKESELFKRMQQGARFGVAIMAPQAEGQAPVAELVEFGAPVCTQGGPANPQGCGSTEPYGIEYRPDLTAAAWGKLPLAKSVAPNSAYMLRLDSGATVARALFQGVDLFYNDFSYQKRIEEIDAQTKALLDTRKTIENRLNQKAQESKRFAL